ncbi:HEPN domain-containing protein [Shewanella sp. SP2S2-4]|uniref:HEPN domain-containing protein n=1 Tax=Shewanella sp. SP2S2-4 TaxID=3063539 RepID=UPI0028907926|nr:HEPN domain-containing protein [Shewanella sp. SP2S2-4]MDT3272879.1 HEPN domain-containing protein [Shewanella sp. SP2S2-4]
MSKARDNFENAIQDAERILYAYDQLNQVEGREREPEELKRAALIMTLTAWETYVEDVIEERLTTDLRTLEGSNVGKFIKSTLERELRYFHTPNSRKTKGMFERFLHLDVTEKWTWIDGDADQVKSKLDQWIRKRGEAVHRSVNDKQATHLVSRPDMKKCLTFFKKLVETTDLAIESV